MTIIEQPKSGRLKAAGKGSTAELVYQLRGQATSNDALNLVIATAPASVIVDGFVLAAIPEIDVDPTDGLGGYSARVHYKHSSQDSKNDAQDQQLNEVDDERTRFTFGSESQHITVAKTQRKYGANSRDVGKVIGARADKAEEPDGMDRDFPLSRIVVTRLYDPATVTNAWLKDRLDQLLTVNDAPWRSLPAESVRLASIEGDQRSDDLWELTFTFEYRENETNIDVGDGVVITDKKGWEYAWTMKVPQNDGNGKKIPKTEGGYVAVIYDKSDFTQLGVTS